MAASSRCGAGSTRGKIERFHPSLRAEFLSTAAPFLNLKTAQAALDAWVAEYNTVRPHQSLKMATPAQRFTAGDRVRPAVTTPTGPDDRGGQDWVSRTVTTNGVVCASWQQVSIGRHYAGVRCDVHVDGGLLRFWVGDQLVKTAARTSTGAVRSKRAFRTSAQAYNHNTRVSTINKKRSVNLPRLWTALLQRYDLG
ncbi:integrase catalytic subunit [Mycolicibacterium vulneris]|nr:integrase catalytic subunit [Mycolicibacterium vulneris]